jgi:uncharacterized protein YbjT (DUF2867 family)
MPKADRATRLLLAGATGLVGSAVVQQAARSNEIAVMALARRSSQHLPGVEWRVADPGEWPAVIKEARPAVFASALGTTWRAAGKSEAAFRAVDQRLVVACARAAREAGAERCILVSSVGADPATRNFYLRVKGEVEQELAGLGFARLDILRPGLLRGPRGGERRLGERAAILASPLVDRLLRGGAARFRSIPAATVAAAILALAREAAPGRFVHHNAEIASAAAPG